MENSSSAWLAKDPAAQKHLGKLYQDADKSLWLVQALDTGRQGDVVHLEHCHPRTMQVAEGGRKSVAREVLSFTGEKRTIPLVKLERKYVPVQEEPADPATNLMAGFSAQLRGVPVGRVITAVKGKSS